MTHCYCHLTTEDRAVIIMMRATHSIRAIATHLGRASSTVSRELARHTFAPSRAGGLPVSLDASLASSAP
ncbi:helix-turn-helix domain-containing protein [Modicisalibacter luteus]